jgi:hypothetical protein
MDVLDRAEDQMSACISCGGTVEPLREAAGLPECLACAPRLADPLALPPVEALGPLRQVVVGDLALLNGLRLVEVLERVERDSRWGCAGWRVLQLNQGDVGSGHGMTQFAPDHIITLAPVEWTSLPGRVLEHRWTFDAMTNRYRRELRKVTLS